MSNFCEFRNYRGVSRGVIGGSRVNLDVEKINNNVIFFNFILSSFVLQSDEYS